MELYRNHPIGSGHPQSKVNELDVFNIRELYKERQKLINKANLITIEKIAEKHDLSASACRDIIYHRTWKHVTGEPNEN